MLLSFIRQDDRIDGILYPSTKIDYSKLNDEHPYNIVLPVKEMNLTGYCGKLESNFNWCKPRLLSNAPRRVEIDGLPEHVTYRMTARGCFIDDKHSKYANSPYGKIESLLINEYLKG